MAKILGLDLGSASIGWALIEENNDNRTFNTDETKTSIVALGSRIIPYDGTEGQDFAKGAGETRNSIRTQKRTMRKGYDRYQQRRSHLIHLLTENDMMPDESLMHASKMALWELRSKAATEDITRQELGRVLLWLNQKRGYKSSRSDSSLDKKETDYVQEIKDRYESIRGRQTIGQYFYEELKKNEYFRVKENIFPRDAYKEEFDIICSRQKVALGLSDELIQTIRDEIIYYQRPLKSQKGLVSVCEFEGFWTKNKKGAALFTGPKVAPKSSPLFQLAKIWESINNININDKSGQRIVLSLEDKQKLAKHMERNASLTPTVLLKELNLKKDDCVLPKQFEKSKGLQGDICKSAIAHILNGRYNHLLEMELTVETTNTPCYLYSRKTGEIIGENIVKSISADIEKSNYYQLWHTIYSISDEDECSRALQKRFQIDTDTADKLAALDLNRYGFGNKSAKALRKILPYLMEGYVYSDAMCFAGYNHSNSPTKEENAQRQLDSKMMPIAKNSLRQPIVEKILNQMVHVVNAVIDKYGKPDEIHIELARELKQSKDERSETVKQISELERSNKKAADKLTEYGLRATRNNILKYRLFEEISDKDNKTNAICIYCGNPISFAQAIKGEEIDIEHIIPKSKLFDDSQSNKTLVHRRCNSSKNDRTAYDFMKSKSSQEFEAYKDRVNKLYNSHIIGKAKWSKLLMPEDKIPDDFIERQLRESQYIARKAKECLQKICSNVVSTSGSVTSELRHLWGWDDITMNLQMPKYKALGMTETIDWTSDHGKCKHSKNVIKDWTKRDDHRHHAIDALVIACTKRGFIQRFNTLSSSKTRDDMQQDVEKRSVQYREKLSLLEKYIISQCPASVSEVEDATAKILVSFKSGKRVAVIGTRKTGKRGNKCVVQRGIIVPRGALSEESVYGKIRTLEKRKEVKYLFEHPDLIFKPYVKSLVEQRLASCDNDTKKAIASLKKDPIYLDKEQTTELQYGTCFKEEYVIKYKVDTGFTKIDKVIDNHIKEILQKRLVKFANDPKKAFKDVDDNGTILKWYEDEGLDRPIVSVRCRTGLSAVVPNNGAERGYVKPGNNHHVAIYTNKSGKAIEHICTFWHAVERKKYGFSPIIEKTNAVWDEILSKPEGSYPQSFLDLLPEADCELLFSMQQNEMFILGMTDEDLRLAFENQDYSTISDHLYRVQKIAKTNYVFRHHLETSIDDGKDAQQSKRFYLIASLSALFELNPTKVRIDYLGNIIKPAK